MKTFSVNNTCFSYDSCLLDFSYSNNISWLSSQDIYPKVYWKDKHTGTTHIGLGSLLCYSDIPQIEQTGNIDLRFFGGIHFPGSAWKELPNTQFWLPCFEVIQTNDKITLIAHFINQEQDPMVFERLKEEKPLNRLSPCQKISHLPNWPEWKKNVERVLSIKQLEKVVLARETQFTTTSPWPLLQALEKKAETATCFAFQFSEELTFLGATPETLFHREKNMVFSEAVAGTRARGTDEDKLAIELKSSAKDHREFAYVKKFIETALLPLSIQLDWQEDQVLYTTALLHLYNKAVITLAPNCTDQKLLAALHPTPAVCGTPTQDALKLLIALEPFQRGWYSGAIGWLGTQGADIAVGIRSALITSSYLKVFAGAGIVQGSDPLKEWEELEAKTAAFYRILR